MRSLLLALLPALLLAMSWAPLSADTDQPSASVAPQQEKEVVVQFYETIKTGTPQQVAEGLDKHPWLLNNTRHNSYTPLAYAALVGRLDNLKLLHERGAELDPPQSFPGSLVAAVTGGHTEIIDYLVGQGLDINQPDGLSITPVQQAVAYKKLDILKHLVSKGAKLYDGKENTTTLLHTAVNLNDPQIVQYLLDAEAIPVDAKDAEGQTPLFIASKTKNNSCFAPLIAAKADINTRKDNGDPLLFMAMNNGNSPMVEALLKQGVDVNVTLNEGSNTLHAAAAYGYLEVAKKAVEKKVPINQYNSQSATPLFLAADRKQPEVGKFLVSKGADVNARNKEGITALHFAANNGLTALIKTLLDKKVDINIRDNHGFTPMHYASNMGQKEVIELLASRKADLNSKSNNGTTALFLASERQTPEIIELLVAKGADIKLTDNNGNPALFFAIAGKRLDNVKKLVELGADLKATNTRGQNAKDIAIITAGTLEITTYLNSLESQGL